MHVPDGFLDAPTSVATAAVAVVGVGVALRGSRRELDDRTAPLAGLVAAFVFAAQMVNFPVGAGTSGHLLGGALAVALVGPWTAVLAISVVLIVQALLFADGGTTALGTNIVLLGMVAPGVSALVIGSLLRVLPRRAAVVPPVAALAGFLSVPVVALCFVGLYAVGGTAPVPLDALVAAMLGWHGLIGLGEALVTGLVVGSVAAARPDLVHAARRSLTARELEIRATVPEVRA
jgi:cobalt/nickel transport system permease protein